MATLDLSNLPYDPQKAREEAARRTVEYERQLAQEQADAISASSVERAAYDKNPNLANKQRLGGLKSVLQGKVDAYAGSFRDYKSREVAAMVERDRESGRRGLTYGLSAITAIATAGAGAVIGAGAAGAFGGIAGGGAGAFGGYELGKKAFDQALEYKRNLDLSGSIDVGAFPTLGRFDGGRNPELTAADRSFSGGSGSVSQTTYGGSALGGTAIGESVFTGFAGVQTPGIDTNYVIKIGQPQGGQGVYEL